MSAELYKHLAAEAQRDLDDVQRNITEENRTIRALEGEGRDTKAARERLDELHKLLNKCRQHLFDMKREYNDALRAEKFGK